MEKTYDVWVHSQDPAFAWLNDSLPAGMKKVWKRLTRGIAVGNEFPSDIVFDLSPDNGIELTDSLGNTDLLHVVSERLKTVVEATKVPVEFHPVKIRNRKKRVVPDPYYVMNLLGPQDAMDRKKSEWDESDLEAGQAQRIYRLVLDPKKVPKEAQLFRLSVDPVVVLVQADLAREIDTKLGLTGMTFQKLESFGEEFRDDEDDEA